VIVARRVLGMFRVLSTNPVEQSLQCCPVNVYVPRSRLIYRFPPQHFGSQSYIVVRCKILVVDKLGVPRNSVGSLHHPRSRYARCTASARCSRFTVSMAGTGLRKCDFINLRLGLSPCVYHFPEYIKKAVLLHHRICSLIVAVSWDGGIGSSTIPMETILTNLVQQMLGGFIFLD
jgi:hypothetical protein